MKQNPAGRKTLAYLAIVISLLAGCSPKKPNARSSTPVKNRSVTKLEDCNITPCLDAQVKSGQSLLWSVTFREAWRELCHKNGQPITFQRNEPETVRKLNAVIKSSPLPVKRRFVQMSGPKADIGSELEKVIRQERGRGTKSTLLDRLEGSPEDSLIIYVTQEMSLRFQETFELFNDKLLFGRTAVRSFGLDEKNHKAQKQVTCFGDFDVTGDVTVVIECQGGKDELVLSMLRSPGPSLRDRVEQAAQLRQTSRPYQFQGDDKLQVPLISLNVIKDYQHLKQTISTGKFAGKQIQAAVQRITFDLNEAGVELSSEVLIRAEPKPKVLLFGKPFLLVLKEADAKEPYFALWVATPHILCPARKASK